MTIMEMLGLNESENQHTSQLKQNNKPNVENIIISNELNATGNNNGKKDDIDSLNKDKLAKPKLKATQSKTKEAELDCLKELFSDLPESILNNVFLKCGS